MHTYKLKEGALETGCCKGKRQKEAVLNTWTESCTWSYASQSCTTTLSHQPCLPYIPSFMLFYAQDLPSKCAHSVSDPHTLPPPLRSLLPVLPLFILLPVPLPPLPALLSPLPPSQPLPLTNPHLACSGPPISTSWQAAMMPMP